MSDKLFNDSDFIVPKRYEKVKKRKSKNINRVFENIFTFGSQRIELNKFYSILRTELNICLNDSEKLANHLCHIGSINKGSGIIGLQTKYFFFDIVRPPNEAETKQIQKNFL